MRFKLLALLVAMLATLEAGCAADFHVGGPHRGMDAGAAVGPVDPPVLTPQAPRAVYTPTPLPAR